MYIIDNVRLVLTKAMVQFESNYVYKINIKSLYEY